MDFLILLEDLERAETVLGNYSYQPVFKSENVAQYVSDLSPFGQIDVLIARREISRGMLERAVVRGSSSGNMRVLQPEDLIGLKLQALVNDPSREAAERADMRALLDASIKLGRNIDWDLLDDYFDLFGKGALLEELKGGHG